MIQWINNLLKKEETTPYDLERMKLSKESILNYEKQMEECRRKKELEEELYDLFRRAQTNTYLRPGQRNIPVLFTYYVDKCIDYGMVQMALNGIDHLNWMILGTNINLDELRQRVYGTKEYKEYLVQKKLEELQEDF